MEVEVIKAELAATWTVVIIKPHVVDHGFENEHLITEAKFEIMKERQMEFDLDTDPDALFELFGGLRAALPRAWYGYMYSNAVVPLK